MKEVATLKAQLEQLSEETKKNQSAKEDLTMKQQIEIASWKRKLREANVKHDAVASLQLKLAKQTEKTKSATGKAAALEAQVKQEEATQRKLSDETKRADAVAEKLSLRSLKKKRQEIKRPRRRTACPSVQT
jgi:hypothetical protein